MEQTAHQRLIAAPELDAHGASAKKTKRGNMKTFNDSELNLNYIDGQWRPASGGGTFANVNPADTRDIIGYFPDSSGQDALDAVGAAEKAQQRWDSLGTIKRGDILFSAAEILARRKDELARAVTREQGKCLDRKSVV